MANEAILSVGTTLTLEASGAVITNGSIVAANDAGRASSDNAGYPLGEFRLAIEVTGTAPTAGAVINLYERKTDGTNAAPVPAGTYKHDYIGTFIVDPATGTQYLYLIAPIWRGGGDYYVEWVDGGSGTEQVDAGWSLTLTPVTYGTA